MSPASRYPTLRVAAVALLALGLSACGQRGDAPVGTASAPAASASAAAGARAGASAPRAAMVVTVEKPAMRTWPFRLQATGGIAAWQEASVGAEIGGLRLATVQANVGDAVRKGQVLASFAREAVEAESLQARAALMQAEAAMENARADAERARSIQDTGALSRSQIAQYLTQEKVAKAQFEAAQAAQAAVQLRLSHTQVLAPDDGLISARAATVGAVVAPGQELFRLVRQGRMEWRAEVTVEEATRLRVGQTAELSTPGGEAIRGKLRAIAPTADPRTRAVLAYVDLPRHRDLRAGGFARGSFDVGQGAALTVPAASVVTRDGFSHVFVVDAASRALLRKVRVGRRLEDRVEVQEGLKADEAVAVQGAGFLNDGDLVKRAP